MNKNTIIIVAVILVVVAAAGGFFGGVMYQKNQTSALGAQGGEIMPPDLGKVVKAQPLTDRLGVKS